MIGGKPSMMSIARVPSASARPPAYPTTTPTRPPTTRLIATVDSPIASE